MTDQSQQAEDALVQLIDAPLDGETLRRQVQTNASGAVVVFSGTTRDHHHDKAVVTLFYEAHKPLAIKEMGALVAAAEERFDIHRAAVFHRLGEVPIGETSVLIAVSSAHRGPAFEAASWLMDQVKENVPIFKKETFTDGQIQWVEEGFCRGTCS